MAANFKVWDGAAFHAATKIRRWNGISYDEVQRIRRWTDNGDGTQSWQDVYVKAGTTPTPSPSPTPTPTPTPPIVLSAIASPNPATGARIGVGVCPSSQVTVYVSNGVPPYSYLFTRSSYTAPSAPTISVDPANANIATFNQDMEGSVPESESAVFNCLITDANGNQGNVSINVTWSTAAQSGTGGSGYKPPHSSDFPSLP